jgi:hydroxymethylbilane synthase
MTKVLLATRKSPLALAQSGLVSAHLASRMPGHEFEFLKIVTTGDQRLSWSLEKEGGKGLFTAEIEQALVRREARIAVHSAKDLPGESADGELVVAGYLPREDTRDVLVLREGVAKPASIATGSPRRRLQASLLFPDVSFTEIRGNVDTRLNKIAAGAADASVIAQAGLNRLGIREWPGVSFRPFSFDEMVPAVAQGAVAVQCRREDAAVFGPLLDAATARAVAVERAFQARLGLGCHVAFGAHLAADNTFHLYHERIGHVHVAYSGESPDAFADAVLAKLGLV